MNLPAHSLGGRYREHPVTLGFAQLAGEVLQPLAFVFNGHEGPEQAYLNTAHPFALVAEGVYLAVVRGVTKVHSLERL